MPGRTKASPNRAQKIRHRTNSNARLLAELRCQSDAFYRTGDWSSARDLKALSNTLRDAPLRQRHLYFHGIRFAIRRAAWYDAVLCPETGKALIGVVAL